MKKTETDFLKIAEKVQIDTENVCFKFHTNAVEYSERFEKTIANKIIKQSDSLLLKFISVSTNLGYLWQIHYFKEEKFDLQNHKYEWENKLSLTDYLFFENVIFQLRAFLDFSQKLSCLVLGYTKPIDGTKDFYKILSKIENEKARKIELKFTEIFNEESWGGLVKSLRDKITHFDTIKTKSRYRPEIRGENYEWFCQKLENDMFILLTELNEILFEKEWKSG